MKFRLLNNLMCFVIVRGKEGGTTNKGKLLQSGIIRGGGSGLFEGGGGGGGILGKK